MVPGHTIVAPWSPNVRYTSGKRNGYHGGAAPAEVVVPLAVLRYGQAEIPGWVDLPPRAPPWWDEVPTDAAWAAASAGTTATLATGPTPRLFEPGPVSSGLAAGLAGGPAWVRALLASAVYTDQHARAARMAPSPDQLGALLAALDAGGGVIGRPGAARAVGVSEARLAGWLTGAMRVLNVDGYEVLAVEDGGGPVRLNRELLDEQFSIGAPKSRGPR